MESAWEYHGSLDEDPQIVHHAGLRRDGQVEVIEGLSAGDEVVIAGQLKLRDGAAVRAAGQGGAPGAPPLPPPDGAPPGADKAVATDGKAATPAGPGK